MSVITSRSNAVFKQLRLLSTSSQRLRRERLALLEGTHLADAFLHALETPRAGLQQPTLLRCIASETALARDDVQGLLKRMRLLAPAADALFTCFADDLFEQLSPVANGGVGLMCLLQLPRSAGMQPDQGAQASSVPSSVFAAPLREDCIVLDGVQDAGNAGSILRSAAAAGVVHAFCMPGTASAWSSKVLRAAMGAHFVMNIVEHLDASQLAAHLAVPVAITDSHGTASVYQCDLREPCAWVFGNEGAGVSDQWRALATHRLTIPQRGQIESLNVAAAAAVCLFEQSRQRL